MRKDRQQQNYLPRRKTSDYPLRENWPREQCVQIIVRDNNVDQALRVLKKKLMQEGVMREMRLREHFEKPSVKRAREKAEAIRRARKLAQKKLNRELGIVAKKAARPSRSK
jgi:small subunit ribosomal protein S21